MRLAKIADLVNVILTIQGENKYRLKIHAVNLPIFNALVSPGGHLVIFRGLWDRMENAKSWPVYWTMNCTIFSNAM